MSYSIAKLPHGTPWAPYGVKEGGVWVDETPRSKVDAQKLIAQFKAWDKSKPKRNPAPHRLPPLSAWRAQPMAQGASYFWTDPRGGVYNVYPDTFGGTLRYGARVVYPNNNVHSFSVSTKTPEEAYKACARHYSVVHKKPGRMAQAIGKLAQRPGPVFQRQGGDFIKEWEADLAKSERQAALHRRLAAARTNAAGRRAFQNPKDITENEDSLAYHIKRSIPCDKLTVKGNTLVLTVGNVTATCHCPVDQDTTVKIRVKGKLVKSFYCNETDKIAQAIRAAEMKQNPAWWDATKRRVGDFMSRVKVVESTPEGYLLRQHPLFDNRDDAIAVAKKDVAASRARGEHLRARVVTADSYDLLWDSAMAMRNPKKPTLRKNPRFSMKVTPDFMGYGVYDSEKDRFLSKKGERLAFEKPQHANLIARNAEARLHPSSDTPFTGSGWTEEKAWRDASCVTKPKRVSPARAKAIIEAARKGAVGPWSDSLSRHMTKGELAFINKVWEKLPGHTSFVGALNTIAQGKSPLRRKRNP